MEQAKYIALAWLILVVLSILCYRAFVKRERKDLKDYWRGTEYEDNVPVIKRKKIK